MALRVWYPLPGAFQELLCIDSRKTAPHIVHDTFATLLSLTRAETERHAPPHLVGMTTYAMETRAYRYCTVVPPYGLVRLRVASGSRAHGAITRAAVLYTSRSAHPACRLCCPRGWSLIHTQWGLSHRNRARNAPKLKERLCLCLACALELALRSI